MGHFHGPRCRSRGTPRQRAHGAPAAGEAGGARERLGARGGPGTCRCSQRERGRRASIIKATRALGCLLVGRAHRGGCRRCGGTGVHTALPKGYEHELFHIASARGVRMRRGARGRALYDHSGCWAVYLKAVQEGGGAALRSARARRGGQTRTAQRAARCLGLWCTHTAGDVLATHSLKRASMVWNACALLRVTPMLKERQRGVPRAPPPHIACRLASSAESRADAQGMPYSWVARGEVGSDGEDLWEGAGAGGGRGGRGCGAQGRGGRCEQRSNPKAPRRGACVTWTTPFNIHRHVYCLYKTHGKQGGRGGRGYDVSMTVRCRDQVTTRAGASALDGAVSALG